eukprot:558666-Prymnesium_polylepis.2
MAQQLILGASRDICQRASTAHSLRQRPRDAPVARATRPAHLHELLPRAGCPRQRRRLLRPRARSHTVAAGRNSPLLDLGRRRATAAQTVHAILIQAVLRASGRQCGVASFVCVRGERREHRAVHNLHQVHEQHAVLGGDVVVAPCKLCVRRALLALGSSDGGVCTWPDPPAGGEELPKLSPVLRQHLAEPPARQQAEANVVH